MARDGLLGEARPSGFPCECRRLQHLLYFRVARDPGVNRYQTAAGSNRLNTCPSPTANTTSSSMEPRDSPEGRRASTAGSSLHQDCDGPSRDGIDLSSIPSIPPVWTFWLPTARMMKR